MEQGIEGKMIELFGKEYLMSDQDILTNEFTSNNSTVPENENHTFCRINSVFSLKDELSNDLSSNVSEKIIKNEPNTNSKKTRVILHLKKKFFSVVDPENDIFKNTIINDMVLYLLNDNFLFNFDCLWNTAECELIKELVIKLIDTLNNTKNNILYLSSCFIMVFCKMANTIEPNELTRAFILFINALKKYVKYVDCELWKKWFLPNNFISWCFVLYTLFMNGNKELAIVFEKSVINDAKKYFKRAKCIKYEIKNNTKVKSGIFELTSSDDILDEMLSSVNTEMVSKNTADASPIEPITPQISVCSEFNVLNSFKTDMISHLLVTPKAGLNDHPAAVNTTKSSNIDENEFPVLNVKKMCAHQEEFDMPSKQQLTYNLDVSSFSVQKMLVENCCNVKATQPINQQPLTSNVIQNQFKTTINTNTSSTTATVKNDKINKQTKQHSTKVVCNKTNIPTSITNQIWTPESTQISISAQSQFMKTKRPTIEQCQFSNSNRTKQSKHCSENAVSNKISTPTINLPRYCTNLQTPTNAQNHLPIASNTWPSNGSMNELEKTQFSTNTVCNKTNAPSNLIKLLSTSLKNQNRTCVPSQSKNTADSFIIENNERSQLLNMITQNNQFATNQVCNNNEPPIYEQSRTSTSANTWFQTSAQNQLSNVSMHLQNNQFVQNKVCKNYRQPVNTQNLTSIPTNIRLPPNTQSQPLYDNMIMETNQFAKNQVCDNNRLPINEQNLTSISMDTRFQTCAQSRSSNDCMMMHSNYFKANQMSNQLNKHVPLIPNYMQSSISEQRLHSNDTNKNHFTDTNSAQFDVLNSSTQTNNQCQFPSAINMHPSSLGTLPSANYTRMNQYDTFTNNNPSIINNINMALQSNTMNTNSSNSEWSGSFYATSYSQPKTYYSHQNTHNSLIQGLCSNNLASITSSSGYLTPTSPHGGVIPNITPSKSATMNSLPFKKNGNYSSKNNMHNSYEPPNHYDQVIIVYFSYLLYS